MLQGEQQEEQQLLFQGEQPQLVDVQAVPPGAQPPPHPGAQPGVNPGPKPGPQPPGPKPGPQPGVNPGNTPGPPVQGPPPQGPPPQGGVLLQNGLQDIRILLSFTMKTKELFLEIKPTLYIADFILHNMTTFPNCS